ncbi:uncharacterized protein LOC126311220 isoform X2 [Schistocerca gregaria]|uniref:uncharacterized protein LOC126311220 isoform X2 n=1 Tax=Schistocerca gregaria TaxID=7010 RepID=UPI00211F0610|nr:uncharacterized protein LOC126311220 isoform X2 [Schistocerca gregaria]
MVMPIQSDEIEKYESSRPTGNINRTARESSMTELDTESDVTVKLAPGAEPSQETIEKEKRNCKRLVPSTLRGTTPAPYVGISNFGNTCYLNSCLQVLYYIPGFHEGLSSLHNAFEEIQCWSHGAPEADSSVSNERSEGDEPKERESETLREFLKSLVGLYAQLGPRSRHHPTDQYAADAKLPMMYCCSADPHPFLKALSAANEQFGAASEQQDVHEFWGWLISYLESGHVHVKKMNERQRAHDLAQSDDQEQYKKNKKKRPREASQDASTEQPEQSYKKKKEETNSCQKSSDPSFVEKMFRGEIRSTVKCLECELESHHDECFYDISLSIEREKNQELSCLLDQFVKKCLLCKSEKYKCSSCLSDVEAFFFTKIHRLPKILVFHLKRFEWCMNNQCGEVHGYIPQMNKINHHISYPEKLVIDPKWLCEVSVGEHSKAAEALEYSLCGIIFHLGTSTYYGHYTAAVKLPDSEAQEGKEWIILDDQRVSYASQQDIVNAHSPEFKSLSTAYMLFYLKT